MTDLRDRLCGARLYLVCGDQPPQFLAAALRGGVDVVQLRMKQAADAAVVAAARRMAAVCAAHGALFILNDRPELVEAAGADGVHVGQHDLPVREARRIIGSERILGLSTHSAEQVDAAVPGLLDYIGVGPVHETPTKPGRAAVGLELVRYAAEHVAMPFFAIGGISPENVGSAADAGATRIAVVRAITDSSDPQRAATLLRRALLEAEATVGST